MPSPALCLFLLTLVSSAQGMAIRRSDALGHSESAAAAPAPPPAGRALVAFEGQLSADQHRGRVTFADHTPPPSLHNSGIDAQDTSLHFPSDSPTQNLPSDIQNYNVPNYDLDKPGNGVVFQDSNNLDVDPVRPQRQRQKKRKRRRKPRLQAVPPGQGLGPLPGAGLLPGVGPQPAVGPLQPGQAAYAYQAHPGQFYRPQRQRRPPSGAAQALAAVTDALTSVALFDDRQCVPRLLCEAASGATGGATSGAVGGGSAASTLLQSVANLQPLLTLLAAYNGASASPLFVFGRAVFLGMTSRSNPGTCRYAYSLCPNDPEELVHYLNNHNGGFFRFFNAPQNPYSQLGQQNLEQFYNQLAGPGQYGLQSNLLNQPNTPGQYGLQQNFPAQNYGLYSQNAIDQSQGPNSGVNGHGPYPIQQNYGLFPNVPHFDAQASALYNGYQQHYGNEYPYQNKYGLNQYRAKDNGTRVDRAQRRIQNNKQKTNIESTSFNKRNTKWAFPSSQGTPLNVYHSYENGNKRGGKQLQFPEKEAGADSSAIGFFFPGAQTNRENQDSFDALTPTLSSYENSVEDSLYAHVEVSNTNNNSNEDGFQLLYILRGDTDPNNPEVIRVRPGEQIQ